MMLRTVLPPLPVAEIQARLSALGVEPHPDYVAHLASYNGAVARNYQVEFGGEGTAGFQFVGFDYDLADLERWAEILSDAALSGVLPLALDAMGNAFVVGSSGRVRFWDHDTHRSLAAFDTIADFVAALERVPGTEPTGPDVGGMPLEELIALITEDTTYIIPATKAGRVDMVDFMMEQYPDYVPRFMVLTAVKGQRLMLQALLDRGVEIDVRGAGGRTPLMAAASNGHGHLVQFLLENGANLMLQSDDGQRASEEAVGRSVILLRDAEAAWTDTP